MIEIEIEEMVGRTEFLARPIRREPKVGLSNLNWG